MKHTTKIELTNLTDLNLADAGVINPKEVRRATIENALVDTGATRLSLPKPLIEQLGLTPVGVTRAMTANGITDRTIYSVVEFTVLERRGAMGGNRLARERPGPCGAHGFRTVRSLS